MNVYVPSRSRADRVAQQGRTLRQLAVIEVVQKRDVFLVVSEDQWEDYVRATSGIIHPKFVLKCPVDGISLVRQWCAQHAAEGSEPYFCMMDDDLGFLIRKEKGDWHLRSQEPDETREMIAHIETLLREGYGAVGVSPREGNNRFDKCPNINTRLIRVLAFDTLKFLSCQHGRVQVMEDFDILLQLLRKGIPNAMLVNYAQGQKQTQEAGGCSDYRSHEVHEASARKLAELHPGFVRLRDKRNKSGGEFGTRKEVTIYWKKAYETSQIAYDGKTQ